ncbi:hypothetical protein BMS3Abin02_02038 [bacterium BMS3Abin02]|nr:hypothetical protein BMS3Abin02_02038 [bacterium BMS3Abin02]GBE22002.1 hypothetical protein BMS3Bbin01_01358 [bacterium BMS3Bbin01]
MDVLATIPGRVVGGDGRDTRITAETTSSRIKAMTRTSAMIRTALPKRGVTSEKSSNQRGSMRLRYRTKTLSAEADITNRRARR